MICTYLGHSTFLLETESYRMLFDPTELPELALDERPLLVFASHRHADHWNPEVLGLAEAHPVTFILSDDIASNGVPEGLSMHWVHPHHTYQIAGIGVETLRSTDEGVAFLLRLGDQVIYYAGDLNWWHWEGESSAYNSAMADAYQKEMQLLPAKIDLAFVPVDPRLGEAFSYGVEGLLNGREVTTLVPMHMWGEYSVIERLKQALPSNMSTIVTVRETPFTWRIL